MPIVQLLHRKIRGGKFAFPPPEYDGEIPPGIGLTYFITQLRLCLQIKQICTLSVKYSPVTKVGATLLSFFITAGIKIHILLELWQKRTHDELHCVGSFRLVESSRIFLKQN